jgi:hypothetical protein
MAKKHMKKCSPSMAIKEIQIKTTLSFHLSHVRIAASITPTTNVSEYSGKMNPHTLLVRM